MPEKIPVSNLAALLYVSFVVSSTVLVGILPVYVNPPTCEESTTANQIVVAKLDEPSDLDINTNHFEFKHKSLTSRQQSIRNKLESELTKRSELKQYTKDIPYCKELTNPGNLYYPWYEPRLPTNYRPLHYKLYFYLPLWGVKSVYSGDVQIKVDILNPTNLIMLHVAYADFPIFRNLTDKDGNKVEIECNGEFFQNEYYIVKTKNNLTSENGPYNLEIIFLASLSEFENGIFEFNFAVDDDPTSANSTMIASRFEPLDARRGFPCMDEPQLKATFEITIDHPINTTALGNTRHTADLIEGANDTFITTIFEITEKMPTSLIAITVFYDADFKYVSGTSKSGIPIKIWARRHFIDENQADIALDFTIKIFNALEDIFSSVNTKSLPAKIDVIAIPDYPNDALPHFGLPIFAENKILMSNLSASERNLQDAALLIGKQLAEFWFGNFVTFKWWDELWLEEALGDYIRYFAIEKAYPNFNIMSQFITEELVNVLIDDGYPSSHPIKKPLDNPFDIEQYFDTVVRSKGAAILKMLFLEIGEQKFFNGLTNYLNNNAWDTGDYNDFVNSFDDIGPWKSKDFFDRWTQQPNYPVVTIDLIKIANKYNISVIQTRHLNSQFSIFSGDLIYPSDYNFTWFIPLKCGFGYTELGNAKVYEQTFYVSDYKSSFQVNLANDITWVQCDREFSGYYVTSYKKSNWDALALALQTNQNNFKPEDRSSIIHHALVEGSTDRTVYSEVVLVLSYLKNESEYLPWRTVYHHVEYLARVLDYSKSFFQVSNFFIQELSHLEKDDLWQPTGDHIKELFSETILEISCRIQDVYCINKTAELWPQVSKFTSNNTVPPYVRSIVYNYHFQNTYDVRDWRLFFRFYESQDDSLEQERYFKALTYTRLPWLLSELVEKVDQIDALDFFDLFKYLAKHPVGREIAWGYFRWNYYDILEKYGEDDPRLGQLLLDISSSFEDEFMFIQLLEFVIYTGSGATGNARFKALEIASTNLIWLIDNEYELINAFGESVKSLKAPSLESVPQNKSKSSEEVKIRLKQIYDEYKQNAIKN